MQEISRHFLEKDEIVNIIKNQNQQCCGMLASHLTYSKYQPCSM